MSTLPQLQSRISQLKIKSSELYSRASDRERGLLYASVALTACFILYLIISPIRDAFDEQSFMLEQVRSNVVKFASDLQRYDKLKERRSAIEAQFEGSDLKEGALSYLETLVSSKAGIKAGGFTLKDSPPRPFGLSYEQTTYVIKFNTTDFGRLVDFLKEVVGGKKPLVLRRLDIKRSRTGDRLEVEIEVSSMRRIR